MLQIAIVVFREILEISLIVGILTAATKDIAGRAKWIISGLTLGIATSAILALFTDKISESLEGNGQEFFNGLILIAAAFMISWTVIWMQKHARSLSGELKRLSNSIRDGKKPLYVLLVVVFFSVLRESTEVVLFTYSYYISGIAIFDIIFGLIIGLILGTIIGIALYLGMLKAFGKYFFSVTTWILVFLASGIFAQGIGFWINAGLISPLKDPIFDISQILSQESYLGKFLHIFFGYMDRPSATQLIAYLFNLSALVVGLKVAKRMS